MEKTYYEKSIARFGFEDCRTIILAKLEDDGETVLAKELWEILTGEYGDDSEEEEFTYEPEWNEDEGFDPYNGCYTYDC